MDQQLNNYLSAILLNTQLALRNSQEKNDYLNRIYISASTVKSLVNREKSQKKAVFNFNLALNETILLNQYLHPQIIFSKNLFLSSNLLFYGDKNTFQEVVSSLLSQAASEYSPEAINKVVMIKTQLKNEKIELYINNGVNSKNWFQQYLFKSQTQRNFAKIKKIVNSELKGEFKSLKNQNYGCNNSLILPLN